MAKVVIGLGYGDEAKGQTVSWLCDHTPNAVVCRYSGGSQAGHHVVRPDGTQHIFASYGSGSLQGAITYIEPTCCVNPMDMWEEYCVLYDKGVRPTIYVHPDAPVVTLYDVYYNICSREDRANGTCGCGIYSTFAREDDLFSLTAGDLRYKQLRNAKVDSIRENYYLYTGEEDFHESLQRKRRSADKQKTPQGTVAPDLFSLGRRVSVQMRAGFQSLEHFGAGRIQLAESRPLQLPNRR